jgi:hypothetical protein
MGIEDTCGMSNLPPPAVAAAMYQHRCPVSPFPQRSGSKETHSPQTTPPLPPDSNPPTTHEHELRSPKYRSMRTTVQQHSPRTHTLDHPRHTREGLEERTHKRTRLAADPRPSRQCLAACPRSSSDEAIKGSENDRPPDARIPAPAPPPPEQTSNHQHRSGPAQHAPAPPPHPGGAPRRLFNLSLHHFWRDFSGDPSHILGRPLRNTRQEP